MPGPAGHHAAPRIIENVAAKIDYGVKDRIIDQINLYLGDNWLYAKDAAEIVRKSLFPETQTKVAEYLIVRIADPENAKAIFKLLGADGKRHVADVGYRNIVANPRDSRYVAKTATNVSDSIDYLFSEAIMSQVKYYIGNGRIMADDAAKIVKKTPLSLQGEVGEYLVPRLVDRDNVNLLINAALTSDQKSRIINAASRR